MFNYIDYHTFEKTAWEHQCNILLKSWGESNKGLVSLLSKKYPALPSRGQGSQRNAGGSSRKILWLFKMGTSASPGLHPLRCAPHWPMALARTGWCATSLNWEQLEWSRTGQRDEDMYTVYRWHLAQRRPKEAIVATPALREAMRYPKLHFQNLLSPTAFGGLWEHSNGLSSCLWCLVSFCAYSQIKWVSRPKGFKLIPPNKKKNPLDPLKHFIWGCKTTHGDMKYQRVLCSSSGKIFYQFICHIKISNKLVWRYYQHQDVVLISHIFT